MRNAQIICYQICQFQMALPRLGLFRLFWWTDNIVTLHYACLLFEFWPKPSETLRWQHIAPLMGLLIYQNMSPCPFGSAIPGILSARLVGENLSMEHSWPCPIITHSSIKTWFFLTLCLLIVESLMTICRSTYQVSTKSAIRHCSHIKYEEISTWKSL